MTIAEILARKQAKQAVYPIPTAPSIHPMHRRPDVIIMDDIEAAIRESSAVAEEDLEDVAAEAQREFTEILETAEEVKTINGETRRVEEQAATGIRPSNAKDSIESTESKKPRAVSSPKQETVEQVATDVVKAWGSEGKDLRNHVESYMGKPVNLLDLLRSHATVEILRESSVWNLLSLPERILLNKEYNKQRQLSGQDRTVLTPEVKIGDDVKAAVALHEDEAVTSGQLEVQAQPVVATTSTAEKLFMQYPSFKALQESAYYKSLNIADKTLVAREYAKQMQLMAMEASRAMREGENIMLKEEQLKAVQQGAAKALEDVSQKHEAFALDVVLNERQMLGVEYAKAGKSFVFTGAAGTGKTTGCREIARALLLRGDLGTHTFKVEDPGTGKSIKRTGPGIAFCAYTRRATANIRRALHKDAALERDLEDNVVTIHRLLEYEPDFYTTPDEPMKQKMRFVPKRTAQNPLSVRVIVIEEASMLGLDLWEKLYAAMRPGTVLIFVGDINQLPPVFGKSIMNYALAQLPVVELTEVYRQALDSGVIVDAHRVLKGLPPEGNKDVEIVEGQSKFAVGQEKMARSMGALFKQLFKDGRYDPNQDIILSPWNKQYMGTININNWIAQFLGEERAAMVYEVLTNRRKMYLAVGDRVMFEKQDGIILRISHNAQYLGKMPQPASTALTRFGLRKMAVSDATTEDFELSGIGYENINIDEVPDEERKAQASHLVTLRMDSGEEETLSSVGDFADQRFSLGYCLTVHKAQGCEWRKVYILLHKDHTLGGFLSRELIYTAMTRAREKLVIIGKKPLLAKAVQYQEIKGNTLQEKIASINAGAVNIGSYQVVKT